MKLDKNKITKYINEGYIMLKKHNIYNIGILNYTKQTEYSSYWDETTMMCRCLIIDLDTYEVVAYPFKKFFNYGQHLESEKKYITDEYEIFEKLDGSYLSLFYYYGDWIITSRGDFLSRHSKLGYEILNSLNIDFNKLDINYNYIFELIDPSNKIVVDYFGMRNIILLAAINKDGDELEYSELVNKYSKLFSIVNKITIEHNSIEDLIKLNLQNKEGFVIKYNNSFRLKAKFDDYFRLHKSISLLDSIIIWEELFIKDHVNDLINTIPDEFYNWINKISSEIIYNYQNEENRILTIYSTIPKFVSKKDFALYVQKFECKSELFAIYDKKADVLRRLIFNRIKPNRTYPEIIFIKK